MPRDIIILHKCTKNDGCNCYFSFWAIFCPFTLPTTQKIKISKKWKKTPGDIIILHMCAKNYNYMMHGSWDMMHDRQMDRQAHGPTDRSDT